MFSKTIFKQTFKANYKLWIVFTLITSILGGVVIAVFDPQTISSMMEMISDTPMADIMGDTVSGFTSILGILGQSFYSLQGIILPLVYIIMTANSLVASQVDKGSMAYTLSTPIKRSKVVCTQAIYLISSVFTMFVVVTLVGLASVQLFHGGIIGEAHTEDVKSAAVVLDLDEDVVADDLNLILENDEALKEGAEARAIDEDVYTTYLQLKIEDQAYQEAADILEIDVDEVAANPALIKNDDEALSEAAETAGMEKDEYSMHLDQLIAQTKASEGQTEQMQNQMLLGLDAAAEALDMESADVASDMGLLKEHEDALDAAVEVSGIPQEMYTTIINTQLANDEVALDEGIDFDIKGYIMLNLGAFLLMFAISGVSFMFSCIFNLSKNSLAFGAGIPLAFFIFNIMATTDDSLSWFKYLSLNTLFDTDAIIAGEGYLVQFIVLAILGVVLYAVGIRVFKEKDLPL